MERLKLRYTPRFDQTAIEHDLCALLTPGVLVDGDLERQIVALEERYRIYTANYHHGLWAPGLVITQEMRNVTELYLPLDEIRLAFNRFFFIALRFSPFHGASTIHSAAGWLDILNGLQPLLNSPSPGFQLRRLLVDENLRRSFIFANFMPARYGGGFGRYPGQIEFLRKWLTGNRSCLEGRVSCLDAACGSGEGTYELALLLIECGFSANAIQIGGITLEPIELFAAAHGYFPHDPRKSAAYRLYANRLFALGASANISFSLEDLTMPEREARTRHDVILCNGLLGGPYLHDLRDLRKTVQGLSWRLRPGGILLAASRFHGGWKKMVGDEMMGDIFAGCGLRILSVAEGVAGEKS